MFNCKYTDCENNIQNKCIIKPRFAHGKCLSSAYDIYDEMYDEIDKYWIEHVEDRTFQEFLGMNDKEYKEFLYKNKK